MSAFWLDAMTWAASIYAAIWFINLALIGWQAYKARCQELDRINSEARTKEAEKLADRMTADRPDNGNGLDFSYTRLSPNPMDKDWRYQAYLDYQQIQKEIDEMTKANK